MTYVSHLESALDGTRLQAGTLQTVHRDRPLWVRYDLDAVRRAVARDDLRARASGLWRYRELLPVRDERNVVSLMRLFITDREAAAALARAIPQAMRLLDDPQARISDELLGELGVILDRASRSASRRLRIDARRGLDVVEVMKGRTFEEALRIGDVARPSRTIDRAELQALGTWVDKAR